MTNQYISTTFRTLNTYLDLYRQAKGIFCRIVVVNLNQYAGESAPISLTELLTLLSEFTKIRKSITDDIIDWLIGDCATDDIIERRIRFVQLKTEETMWGKHFGEYDDENKWVPIVDSKRLSKYYSVEDIATIRTVLDNIDANITLINKYIVQGIEQVKTHFLNPLPDTSTELPTIFRQYDIFRDNPKVANVFIHLIEDGLMKIDGNHFRWLDDRTSLCYLCYSLNLHYDLNTNKNVPWVSFSNMFLCKVWHSVEKCGMCGGECGIIPHSPPHLPHIPQ